MKISLLDIANWLGVPAIADVEVTGVSIDTRTLVPGNLFVALQGEHADGHDFIDDAIEKGARAILCSKPQIGLSVPQLLYPDLEKALALMGVAHREQFGCKVLALTGSNGKTSVKEMLASILPEKSFVTPGNWNNHLGVPLSLLQVDASYDYAVFELGANHVGEIAYTVGLVKPEVALVNNIGPAHIAEFGSMENIATGKGEIYAGLAPGGIAIVNADDEYAHFWDDTLQDKKVLRFSSKDKTADIYAENIVLDAFRGSHFTLVIGHEKAKVSLNVPGAHHVQNALAAASCAYTLGCSIDMIAKGLATFSGVAGRLLPKKTAQGAVILDDSYNANLSSVLSGVRVLGTYSGQKVLVLGDMSELGGYARAHHKAVGEAAKAEGIDCVMSCGEHSAAATAAFGKGAEHFQTQDALVAALKPKLDKKTTVLVKGSRSSHMEHVVAALL